LMVSSQACSRECPSARSLPVGLCPASRNGLTGWDGPATAGVYMIVFGTAPGRGRDQAIP
jgi:hypothetical protein